MWSLEGCGCLVNALTYGAMLPVSALESAFDVPSFPVDGGMREEFVEWTQAEIETCPLLQGMINHRVAQRIRSMPQLVQLATVEPCAGDTMCSQMETALAHSLGDQRTHEFLFWLGEMYTNSLIPKFPSKLVPANYPHPLHVVVKVLIESPEKAPSTPLFQEFQNVISRFSVLAAEDAKERFPSVTDIQTAIRCGLWVVASIKLTEVLKNSFKRLGISP
eukprot:Protomagalhaensia_wolfi_Nauph_80__3344@NODE_3401_length_808_cov_95_953186_g2667_i0_p1_GENE_NODE_3401_length_808_cov_95_953186_g2667_i0NODE_3401_length_808_cov_95_953186_g2667_i0_p1_ORF_typecomplete_len219_score8_03_NODE_3401_length_808_cov_95_953186_g2667_i036692